MIGAGVNKLNISGIKMEFDDEVINDIGEGLGVAVDHDVDRDYIEALQFTGVKKKKSKTLEEQVKQN